MSRACYRAVVMGASMGGMEALISVLGALPEDFSLPVLVVQHLHASDRGRFARHLDQKVQLRVKSAVDKEQIYPARVYLAPANYHLLVERDETLAMSLDLPVNWSRPSIDVMFESAARVWCHQLIGLILSGTQRDGAFGLSCVAERGGLTLVQDPQTAHSDEMPRAALDAARVDHVLPLSEIGGFLRVAAAQSESQLEWTMIKQRGAQI
ncbi:chemotaxis protein CheB [Dongshaea marina]|uniref:chemotaxis protein CheB n=1 Tax=Dongshaea marina TaxID=2047966 RepID=UPI000D3E4726|nr:chemotaxis protein CheB [Dongshaea marina]